MPEWKPEIRRRLALGRAGLPPEREAEIVDEVAQHLEERYRDGVAAGRTVAEAAAAAWAELEADGVLAAEVQRALPRAPMPPAPEAPVGRSFLPGLMHDVRYAVRRLAARPAFAITAIVTVALSVGPATTVIGMADALFFTPRPGVQYPERLFFAQFGRPGDRPGSFSPTFLPRAVSDALAADTRVIVGMAGQQQASAGVSANGAEPARVNGQSVQAGFFELLGVRMAAGRPLVAADGLGPGGVASVVLADGLARAMFGGAEAAVGKTVQLNSVPFTVVGVTDAAFQGSRGTAKFWVSGPAALRMRHFPAERLASMYNDTRGPFYEYVVGFRPGATYAQAAAELDARLRAVGETNPAFKTIGFHPYPGLGAPRSLNQGAVDALRLLSIVAALLVVLGMANMANLLIFRGLKIGREIAIRKALGASVARLIQLTLVESVLLALAGAAVGVLVALGIETALSGLSVQAIGAVKVPVDWRLIGATAVLSLAVGVGFGLVPAWLTARGSASLVSRGARGGAPRVGRTRQFLAATQLALSVVLLVGALLFLATVRNLRAVDVGFDPRGVISATVSLSDHGYDVVRGARYADALVAALQDMPGVDAAAAVYATPLSGFTFSSRLFRRGTDRISAQEMVVDYASPGYFDAIRTPIIRGRAFTAEESRAVGGTPPVVLSATAAKTLFGDDDPLGQLVTEPGRTDQDYVVVGVTAPTRWDSVQQPYDPIAYLPLQRLPLSSMTVIARSSRRPADVEKMIRAAAASVDPSVPPSGFERLTSTMDSRFGSQVLFAYVLGILGAIGFLLAAVGLQGLVSQMVSERSREFGIRLAIGAGYGSVMRLVLGQAALVAAVGAAGGWAAALLAGRLVEAKLFGVTTREPLIFGGATAMLLIVVGVALIGPLRATLKVQPIDVLRTE